ncbi:MAG: PRC-barrel domain-containing protein [Bacillota bacterium]|nr:PRC-barrel domain-containing protein [Bacillota bacterium]
MHFSVRSLIGKPVVELPGCRIRGWVKSVFIDAGNRTVCGMECIERNPFLLVSSFALDSNVFPGKHCVMISGETKKAAKKNRFLPLGLKVSGQSGTGFVTDVIFEGKTGKITSFEVTDGFFDDIRNGRRFLKNFTVDPVRINTINEVREWKE